LTAVSIGAESMTSSSATTKDTPCSRSWSGGFLGIGSRLVAVPYDSLTIDQKGSKIEKIALPGASKDQLEKLTEFRYGI
jgi:hypothetical protein